jgi:hypothetical protein
MAKPQSSSTVGSDKSGGSESPGAGSLWAIVVGGAILALAGYLVFGAGAGTNEHQAGGDKDAAAGGGGGANSGPKARRADAAMNSRASSPAVQRATTELASAAGGATAPDAPKTPEERTDALVDKLEKYKKRLTELEASLVKHDEGKAKFIGTYDSAVEGEKKWQSQRDGFEKAIESTKKQIESVEALLEAE